MPPDTHLEEARQRLEAASSRVDAARREAARREAGRDGLQQWLAALAEYASALSDVQRLGTESIQEVLRVIGERAGIRRDER